MLTYIATSPFMAHTCAHHAFGRVRIEERERENSNQRRERLREGARQTQRERDEHLERENLHGAWR